MENKKKGTPFSNCVKLHDQIGNIKEDHIQIADSLFENAEEYFFASQVMLKLGLNHFNVAYVNAAFSCELYLKSVIFQFKNDNNRIKEHRLYELYNMLPLEQQHEIESCCRLEYERQGGFNNLLKEVSEAFVFARYTHERKMVCFSIDFFNLAFAVRSCVKKLYNARIIDRNNEALEKLEEYKLANIEQTLVFYIYYDENHVCNVEMMAKDIVKHLCETLKKDYLEYQLGGVNDDWVKKAAIVLHFSRQSYIFSVEYDNIVETTRLVFKKYGMPGNSFRTNGHHVSIKKTIEY